MMAQKHLHELLKEDQEPFLLKNYIADRRYQLKNSSPISHLHINKRKPISQYSNFCKKACFLSFHDSPDLRKSPLFEPKSPSNSIFLLEAALRIQNKSSSKTKPQSKNSNGLFGSILKRLTLRNKNPKRETGNGGSKVLVKDVLRWDLTVGKNNVINEDKSEVKSMDIDLGTSCTCNQPEEFEEIFISSEVLENNNSAFPSFDEHFPQSPFRFVLQTRSPSRHAREDKENYELERLKRLQVEEEEEKQQCSPVSVLDRPFEDDDDRHEDDEDGIDDNGIGRFDLECKYTIVQQQRAKHQLLQNLRRFEKLAELDPIELEKRMVEQEQDDANDSFSSQSEINTAGYNLKHIPDYMKRLVSDLIAEEETMNIDKQAAAQRVSKRLESWKEVESNTIDMMVEQDFRRDQNEGWKGNEEEIRETGIEVESGIFGLLMQELIQELVF